jgi:hypothetical protein
MLPLFAIINTGNIDVDDDFYYVKIVYEDPCFYFVHYNLMKKVTGRVMVVIFHLRKQKAKCISILI